MGLDSPLNNDKTFFVEAKRAYRIQKRKHRKKRTNKKWAKRYGCDVKFKEIKIEQCVLNALRNNELEITGNPILEKEFNYNYKR